MSVLYIRKKLLDKLSFNDPLILDKYNDDELNIIHTHFVQNKVPRWNKYHQRYDAIVTKCISCNLSSWIGFMLVYHENGHVSKILDEQYFLGYDASHCNVLCQSCQKCCGCSDTCGKTNTFFLQKCDNCHDILCKKHKFNETTYNCLKGTQTTNLCLDCTKSCGCTHMGKYTRKNLQLRCELCSELQCKLHKYNTDTNTICNECKDTFVKLKLLLGSSNK